MSELVDHQESDESSATIDLADLDINRHLGCSEIDISTRATAYSYDDEEDHIVLRGVDDETVTLTPGEARQVRADLDTALEALKEEETRRYFDQ
jgi:hypothetical protein